MIRCPKCFATKSIEIGPSRVLEGGGTLPDGRAYSALRLTFRRCSQCRQSFTHREPAELLVIDEPATPMRAEERAEPTAPKPARPKPAKTAPKPAKPKPAKARRR